MLCWSLIQSRFGGTSNRFEAEGGGWRKDIFWHDRRAKDGTTKKVKRTGYVHLSSNHAVKSINAAYTHCKKQVDAQISYIMLSCVKRISVGCASSCKQLLM